MAIQFMDDFTGYGTDATRVNRMTNGVYAAQQWVDLVADPDPAVGAAQYCCTVGANSNSTLRRVLSAAQATVGVALRIWMTALPTAPTLSFKMFFADVNNVNHLYLMANPSGYLEVWRTDNGGDVLMGTSTSPAITANAWRHFEMKVFFSNTVGTVEVRSEGSVIINLSAVRTISTQTGVTGSCQNINFFNNFSAPGFYMKDYIVWDGSGTVNNNFLGTCQVYKIIPDADISLNWTPNSGGVGFSKVNETTPDDDAGYVTAPFPLPTAMTLNLSDVPANVTAVKGVQVIHRSKKADGGDGNIQASLISGANTGPGSNRPITTSYTYWQDVFDQDPSGGAWNKALVNALKLKLDRTV